VFVSSGVSASASGAIFVSEPPLMADSRERMMLKLEGDVKAVENKHCVDAARSSKREEVFMRGQILYRRKSTI
jgi:hypothetical protein